MPLPARHVVEALACAIIGDGIGAGLGHFCGNSGIVGKALHEFQQVPLPARHIVEVLRYAISTDGISAGHGHFFGDGGIVAKALPYCQQVLFPARNVVEALRSAIIDDGIGAGYGHPFSDGGIVGKTGSDVQHPLPGLFQQVKPPPFPEPAGGRHLGLGIKQSHFGIEGQQVGDVRHLLQQRLQFPHPRGDGGGRGRWVLVQCLVKRRDFRVQFFGQLQQLPFPVGHGLFHPLPQLAAQGGVFSLSFWRQRPARQVRQPPQRRLRVGAHGGPGEMRRIFLRPIGQHLQQQLAGHAFRA